MAQSNNTTKLSLYHYNTCPYCAVTKQAINATDIDVEYRNISTSNQFKQELIKFGGKKQVPALKIEYQDKPTQWLYESADIIKFIRRQAA